MFLALRSFGLPHRGGPLLLAAVTFAAGLTGGALIAPASVGRDGDKVMPMETRAAVAAPVLRDGHPADVVRVIDGDTFEARVHIWPGMQITTRVRLRGIDAPEMHARCDDERAKALAARDELSRLLAEGTIGITRVGQDKYGGRVDADVSTAKTPNVSETMFNGGFARRYFGGRRESWCG